MLNIKKLFTRLLKCDLVIEQGTENGWFYRKWSNALTLGRGWACA